MKISFTKMSGAGNDFVVIDNRKRKIVNGRKVAKRLCDRRWGIGADGILLLEKSRRADYRMMYFNADGSYGGMCGNGGRCIARFAVLNGIAEANHRFEALNHVYSASVKGTKVELMMKDPQDLRLGGIIKIDGHRISVNYVDTGSPHAVANASSFGRGVSLQQVQVMDLGSKIRYHDAFNPSGTNANFIERGRGNSIHIRTYERGVEAETLACGTGSIAAAIVASKLWKLRSPVTVIPESKKPLTVSFYDDGIQITKVRLEGPATVSFQGEIEV